MAPLVRKQQRRELAKAVVGVLLVREYGSERDPHYRSDRWRERSAQRLAKLLWSSQAP